MSLKLKRKKVNKAPPFEAGTYMAVCVGVIDIGEQHSKKFNTYQDKVMLIFEIPSETIEIDGEVKPRWLSQEYSASLNEKSNLYKMLTSWRGKEFSEDELAEDGTGFDLASMAGTGCMIAVTLDEKESGTYNNISSVVGLPKGMPVPELQNEILVFDVSEHNDETFEKLPEWIQKKIKSSTQYQTNPTEEKLDIPEDKGGCPI